MIFQPLDFSIHLYYDQPVRAWLDTWVEMAGDVQVWLN